MYKWYNNELTLLTTSDHFRVAQGEHNVRKIEEKKG